jgi:hypothetical protein
MFTCTMAEGKARDCLISAEFACPPQAWSVPCQLIPPTLSHDDKVSTLPSQLGTHTPDKARFLLLP